MSDVEAKVGEDAYVWVTLNYEMPFSPHLIQ